MTIHFVLIISAIFSIAARASTFVGNGGSTQDIELQVTVRQIQKSFQEIRDDAWERDSLCGCNQEMQQHPLCKTLETLSDEQRRTCRSYLVSKADEFISLINSNVQINWTDEKMEVVESRQMRPVQGIASHSIQNIIYLNHDQFLQMKPYQRAYLLTHELGHLIAFNKVYVSDEQAFESFKQPDGGRAFLNSLGASTALISLFIQSADENRNALERSQNTRRHWISFDLAQDSEHDDTSAFAIKKYRGGALQYRYQITTNYGVSASYRRLQGDEIFMQIARAENDIQLIGFQLNYILRPFENPLTWFGQSHFVFGAGYEFGEGRMKVDDGFVTANDSTKTSSVLVSARYFIPSVYGFWLNAGINATFYKYKYDKIGFESQNHQVNYVLGVSYGF